MKFDVTKDFGSVHGSSEEYSGAKYQQGPYIYDAHRVCMNPDIEVPEDISDADKATDDKIRVLESELDKLSDKIQVARKRVEDEGTAISKATLTKLANKFNKLTEELERFDRA